MLSGPACCPGLLVVRGLLIGACYRGGRLGRRICGAVSGFEQRFAAGDLGAGWFGRRFAGGDLGLAGLGDAPALWARTRLLMDWFADGPEPLGPVMPERRMLLWRRLAPRVPRWVVPERRGCAGDLVCRRSPINSFLKFNLYLIFSGKVFEQKLDIIFHIF